MVRAITRESSMAGFILLPSWQDSGIGRVFGLQHRSEIGIVANFGMTSVREAPCPGSRKPLLLPAVRAAADICCQALSRDMRDCVCSLSGVTFKFVSIAEIGHAGAADRPQARPFGEAKPNERPDPGGSR